MIRIWFEAKPSDVGIILVLLQGKAKNINFEVVSELPHDKNTARGSTSETMLEIIRQNPGAPADKVRDIFVSRGFKRTAATTATKILLEKKKIKRGPRSGKSFTYTAL